MALGTFGEGAGACGRANAHSPVAPSIHARLSICFQLWVGIRRGRGRVGPAAPVHSAPLAAAQLGLRHRGRDVPVAVLRSALRHVLLAQRGPLPVQHQLPAQGGGQDLVCACVRACEARERERRCGCEACVRDRGPRRYGVPGSSSRKFEELMVQNAPARFSEDRDLLHQLIAMASPALLRSQGAPWQAQPPPWTRRLPSPFAHALVVLCCFLRSACHPTCSERPLAICASRLTTSSRPWPALLHWGRQGGIAGAWLNLSPKPLPDRR
jgi:hypothetical protein